VGGKEKESNFLLLFFMFPENKKGEKEINASIAFSLHKIKLN